MRIQFLNTAEPHQGRPNIAYYDMEQCPRVGDLVAFDEDTLVTVRAVFWYPMKMDGVDAQVRCY